MNEKKGKGKEREECAIDTPLMEPIRELESHQMSKYVSYGLISTQEDLKMMICYLFLGLYELFFVNLLIIIIILYYY